MKGLHSIPAIRQSHHIFFRRFRKKVDTKLHDEIKEYFKTNCFPCTGQKNKEEKSNSELNHLQEYEYIESSPELKKAVEEMDINYFWNKLNILSEDDLEAKRDLVRPELTKLNNKYYSCTNKIFSQLRPYCQYQAGKKILERKYLIGLLLTVPFYVNPDSEVEFGTFTRSGLVISLLIILLISMIISFIQPNKLYAYFVLSSKQFKNAKINISNDLNVISQRLAQGKSNFKNFDLNYLVGKKINNRFNQDLDRLHEIKYEASTYYVRLTLINDVLERKAANKELKAKTILFGNGIEFQVRVIPYNLNIRLLRKLKPHEKDIFFKENGFEDKHEISKGFKFILEWLEENKYYEGSDGPLIEYIKKRLSEVNRKSGAVSDKKIRQMLKGCIKTNDIDDVRNWLVKLSYRITKNKYV